MNGWWILRAGNTPACAGKRNIGWTFRRALEIPPRARGRATIEYSRARTFGNTPACAGKSSMGAAVDLTMRKYPRVRGEELRRASTTGGTTEIPPRARGRVAEILFGITAIRNTPACAGKSFGVLPPLGAPRKYPRVRGEESRVRRASCIAAEIPPRARGRGDLDRGRRADDGNTPACAGKSRTTTLFIRSIRKYPRVRGEETRRSSDGSGHQEIPPRARGRGSAWLRLHG